MSTDWIDTTTWNICWYENEFVEQILLPNVAEPTPPRHDVIFGIIVQIFVSGSKHSTESSGELSSKPPEIIQMHYESTWSRSYQVCKVDYWVQLQMLLLVVYSLEQSVSIYHRIDNNVRMSLMTNYHHYRHTHTDNPFPIERKYFFSQIILLDLPSVRLQLHLHVLWTLKLLYSMYYVQYHIVRQYQNMSNHPIHPLHIKVHQDNQQQYHD